MKMCIRDRLQTFYGLTGMGDLIVTCASVAEKYNISMPITEKINEILFEGKNAKDAVRELMLRDRKVEYE